LLIQRQVARLDDSVDVGEQTGSNQCGYVARVDFLHWLMTGKLINLTGHLSTNLRRAITAVEHLNRTHIRTAYDL
jgi:hypothetical protein